MRLRPLQRQLFQIANTFKKYPLGRPGRRVENGIKIDFKEKDAMM
jgi:hypothetical protein